MTWARLRIFVVVVQLGLLIALWIGGDRLLAAVIGFPLGKERLFVSAGEGNPEGIRQALAERADVNAVNDLGDPPLVYAATFGNLSAARALLNAGANVNLPGSCGTTALMRSVANGRVDLVKMLLQAGADPHLRDRNGQTARQIAEKLERNEIQHLLQDAERAECPQQTQNESVAKRFSDSRK